MSTDLSTQVQQQVNSIAAIALNLDDYAVRLTELAQDYAHDPTALAIIEDNWSLANAAANAHTVAASAIETAQSAITQRDTAIEQLSDLELAMADIDTNHPAVAQLVEIVEEGVSENWDDLLFDERMTAREEGEDAAYDSAREAIEEEIVYTLEKHCCATPYMARRFADILIHGFKPARVSAEKLAFLGEFINGLED